jgi:putative ABC transport system permease protein
LTTISQIILKERTQIGTMKALGLSNREIYAHYIGLTLSVVSIGILIGEIIGPILMPFLLGQNTIFSILLPARTYVFPVLYGLLTAAFFLRGERHWSPSSFAIKKSSSSRPRACGPLRRR